MSPFRSQYNLGLLSPSLTPLTASSVSLPDTAIETSDEQVKGLEPRSTDDAFAEGGPSYPRDMATEALHFASNFTAERPEHVANIDHFFPAPSDSPAPLHSPVLARLPTPFSPAPPVSLTIPPSDPSDSLIVRPPPRGPFTSRSHVDVVMHAYAVENSFDITVNRSDKARHTVTYACVRGGKYRCTRGASHELTRKRKVYTGKTECPWRLTVRDTLLPPGQLAMEGAEERWEWREEFDLVNCHNHPPIPSRTLPKVRKQTVTLEIREWVEREVWMGTLTRPMLGKLQMEFPNCLVTLSDLRNMVAIVRKGAPLVNAITVKNENVGS